MQDKMDDSFGRTERGDDEPMPISSSWLGIEEVSPLNGKKKDIAKQAPASGRRWSPVASATVVVLIMTTPPLLFLLSGRLGAPVVWIRSTVASIGAQQQTEPKKDALLGGLLHPGFDEQACASRYQAVYYRKNLTRQPSPHLIERLREQEALQRRCGPGTEPYARASDRLRSGQTGAVDGADADGCSYLVLISYRGLGNRMLAIASVFLYALLTNRVLFVDRGYGNTLPDLFCEPFPGATWALPLDFPLDAGVLRQLDESAPESYGNVVVNRSGSVSGMRFAYLHLDHAASPANRLVYCDDDSFLRRMQWAVIRTDQYMAPGLFFNPAHQAELDRLFPRKDSVFLLLSRYLLHPTNDVWGMVTRYYDAYLRDADERLGIQIRVLFGGAGDKPARHVLDQILACTARERLLPPLVTTDGGVAPRRSKSKKLAILVTGLSGWYHDSIREMYWTSATAGGEVVSLFQPSHEEHQQWYQNKHDMKAAAEIYLLSLTDKIVTSAWSTFGYVGYSMGGLRPYLMYMPDNQTAPDPPCTRAMSMEPCSHGAPSFECTRKEINAIINTGLLLPQVRACEDISWGLKLTDPEVED